MATQSTVFVYTLTKLNSPGTWSRYLFPFTIDDFARLDDVLYIRSGDDVLFLDDAAVLDFNGDPRAVPFDGLVQWAWLDDGAPGVEKMWDGIDLVGDGIPTVSIGYDQTNPLAFTDDYVVPQDSIPGALIPIAIMCPSASVRVKYPGPQQWRLQSVNLWLQDQRGRP